MSRVFFDTVDVEKTTDIYLQIKFRGNVKGTLESSQGGEWEVPWASNDLQCDIEEVEVEIQNEDMEGIKTMTLTLEELYKQIGEILAFAKDHACKTMIDEVERDA